VSDAKLAELKQRVRAFRQELLQAAEVDDHPERVVQVNFQVFALSASVGTSGAPPATDEVEDPHEEE
jgi:hypothetical protein